MTHSAACFSGFPNLIQTLELLRTSSGLAEATTLSFQVCWCRETFKTCRTVGHEDQGWRPGSWDVWFETFAEFFSYNSENLNSTHPVCAENLSSRRIRAEQDEPYGDIFLFPGDNYQDVDLDWRWRFLWFCSKWFSAPSFQNLFVISVCFHVLNWYVFKEFHFLKNNYFHHCSTLLTWPTGFINFIKIPGTFVARFYC